MDAAAHEWTPRLRDLCRRIRREARTAVREALEAGDPGLVARVAREGAGDVTYALDERTERAVDGWLEEVALERPISLCSEDAGWRHHGPGPRGQVARLAGFDHGGPRIALDPVDGTRNLMADLRSAWSVVSFAGPGRGEPRLSEVELGLVAEIADSRGASYRVLSAARGSGCRLELCRLEDDAVLRAGALRADSSDRADHGYFPFFRYAPDLRPRVAAIEAGFFARLEREEGAELRHCFDDQYICNAGQLALLALGTYRMIADVRSFVSRRTGARTTTSKPYDVAGAILCAREAGCVVTGPRGEALDFPLDCSTEVDFVGWANPATERRLAPHLRSALETS